MTGHLHETLAYLRDRIQKLTAAHDLLAEAIGAGGLDHEPESATAATPGKPEPKATKPAAVEPTKRKSKYFDPLVAFLKTGGKSQAEIARHLDVQAGGFVHVLVNNADTFRKIGDGRGATWELAR